MAIELQEMEAAFDDIISQAVAAQTDPDEQGDVAFLKERIRTLESLIEESIDKI